MQFNGPVLPGYGQEPRKERSLEVEERAVSGPEAEAGGRTHGEALDQRLASDQRLREIHAAEVQAALDFTYRLESLARTACVLAGLLSLPIWPLFGRLFEYPEWTWGAMYTLLQIISVMIPISSMTAAGAWCWRKHALRKAAAFCLEVRDPARRS